MIKEPTSEQIDKTVIDVILRNGEVYRAKDITKTPFGEHEQVVAFWHDGAIMMFPMDVVQSVRLYFDN